MYPPPYHQSSDVNKMIALIKKFPLGMLVSTINGKLFVTHIPIIYNETINKLVAHIDKFNPQLDTLKEGAEVTIVFKGPDTYISPSIYTTTQLPTWNYMIVHVTGTIELINNPDDKKDTMIAMTQFLEGSNPQYVLDKGNPSMDRMVNYIEAFKIDITKWEGKFKLSQDKNEEDQEIAKLELIKNSQRNMEDIIELLYK